MSKMQVDDPLADPNASKWTFSLGQTSSRLNAPKRQPMAMQADDDDIEMEDEKEITVFDETRHKKEKKEDFLVIPVSLANEPGGEEKPLLLRNRIKGLENIEDETERYKVDVQQRPDECTLQDYNKTPYSKFGEGYLRALGWTPGAPVGKSNSQVVPVISFISRPSRMGLGAKVQAPPDVSKDRIIKPGESREGPARMEAPVGPDGKVRHYKTSTETLKAVKKAFYKGAPVFIKAGKHSGLKAKVYENHGNYATLLLPNDERVKVDLVDLDQLDDPEYLRKKAWEKQVGISEDKHEKKDKDKKRGRDSKRSPSPSSKRKRSKSPSKKTHKSSKSAKSSKPLPPCWVCSDIRVKICSKELAQGKYYCKIGWVTEVLGQNRCSVALEEPRILIENVHQDDLETMVPPVGKSVRILVGEYKGQKGSILERYNAKGKLDVQLDEDLEIATFNFDDVATCK